MKSLKTILLSVISIFIFNCIHAQLANSKPLMEKENHLVIREEIIKSYVSDYQNDRFAAEAMIFWN